MSTIIHRSKVSCVSVFCLPVTGCGRHILYVQKCLLYSVFCHAKCYCYIVLMLYRFNLAMFRAEVTSFFDRQLLTFFIVAAVLKHQHFEAYI